MPHTCSTCPHYCSCSHTFVLVLIFHTSHSSHCHSCSYTFIPLLILILAPISSFAHVLHLTFFSLSSLFTHSSPLLIPFAHVLHLTTTLIMTTLNTLLESTNMTTLYSYLYSCISTTILPPPPFSLSSPHPPAREGDTDAWVPSEPYRDRPPSPENRL